MIKYLGSKLATGSSLLALGSSLKAIKSLHQKKLYRFINGTIGCPTAQQQKQNKRGRQTSGWIICAGNTAGSIQGKEIERLILRTKNKAEPNQDIMQSTTR